MNYQIINSLVCLVVFNALFLSPSQVIAMAGSPPQKEITLPDGALNALQIEQQFKGRTALADVPVKGKKEVYFFAEDGQVIEARDGWQKSGTWYVRDDARLCIDLKGEHRDCRMIVKEGDKYHQYAAKRDGNHRYEQTYYNFRAGEQLQSLSPKPILPLTTLRREEIVDIFSDKTVESVTARQGRVSVSYYSPDGKVEQLRNGVKRYGTWWVTGSSRICLQMEGLQEKCRIIVKEGEEYKKYIVKKNGNHQHSVSYRKFQQGKQF